VRNEVLAQMRAGMQSNGTLVAALAALDRVIAGFYLAEAPCC
jgi:hypothetical protein